MSRGGNTSGHRQTSPATAPDAERVAGADAEATKSAPIAEAEPATTPKADASQATSPRFVVAAGEVLHNGRTYVMGEYVPVSEAQAMLMPWAIERR